jgi:hypothetical protein
MVRRAKATLLPKNPGRHVGGDRHDEREHFIE